MALVHAEGRADPPLAKQPAAKAASTPGCARHLLGAHALAALVNPNSCTSESPVFLPVLPVEPSPTTGLQTMIPPLFHTTAARAASTTQPPVPGSKLGPPPLPAPADGRGALPPRHHHQQQEPSAPPPAAAEAPRPPLHGKMSTANSDGWQWRKYGEKMVKGSSNPRSYYKCSHQSCAAKKIVERNEAGDILATEYKGDHSHPAPSSVKASRFRPKPPLPKPEPQASAQAAAAPAPSGRPAPPPPLNIGLMPGFNGLLPIPDALRTDIHGDYDEDDDDDSSDSQPEPAVPLKTASQDSKAAMRAASAVRKLREMQAQQGLESPSKRLDVLAAYAEAAQQELHLSNSNGTTPDRGPPSKRQRVDVPTNPATTGSGPRDATGSAGTAAQDADMQDADLDGPSGAMPVSQKVVEVEQVDDGFRWRKYGQKQVKGSPFPRSYYKCTHPGCTVRKHVERSLDSGGKYIVTYEGAHTHPSPMSSGRTPSKHSDDGHDAADGDAPEQETSEPTSPGAPTAPSSSHHPGNQLQLQVDASGAAAGAWDPLTCLATPRPDGQAGAAFVPPARDA